LTVFHAAHETLRVCCANKFACKHRPCSFRSMICHANYSGLFQRINIAASLLQNALP